MIARPSVIYHFFFFHQGLVQINTDVVSLAAKARDGKLQPQEFQVGSVEDSWAQGYKTFFIFNSAEHEIFPANKY